MKKKAEEKKGNGSVILEIVPIFEPGLYWEYKAQSSDVLEKTDAFINMYSNELKALVAQDKSF